MYHEIPQPGALQGIALFDMIGTLVYLNPP
jgi:hypothetical protein